MESSTSPRTLRLVDHLVRLSGLRRRDELLNGITLALAETLPAHRVSLHSLVHDENQRYWLPLTEARAGESVRLLSDPMRTELNLLAPLASDPQRLRCLEMIEPVVSPPDDEQPCFRSRFPVMVADGKTPWGVAEVLSMAPLDSADIKAATRLLSLYGNILDMLDYSECDALTGLWNRKPFDDLFYKTLRPTEPLEEGAPSPDGVEHRCATPSKFWLAMVDIDHFKQVNDTYGHLIGDEVLILVARLLKTAFRVYDRVYRFGGEEFVVVLRSGDHDAAVAALERFRQTMASHEFPQAGTITASVGLTEILAGDSPAAACERADQAVYYAKHHGRNQVCSEPDLVRRGLLKVDLKIGDVELF